MEIERGGACCMHEEKRIRYSISMEKRKGRKPLDKPRRVWMVIYGVNMGFKYTVYEHVVWLGRRTSGGRL